MRILLSLLLVLLPSIASAQLNEDELILELESNIEYLNHEAAVLRQEIVGNTLRIRSLEGVKWIGKADGTCPDGWEIDTTLQGRFPLGNPASGTIGGTQGAVLSNRELRRGGTGHGGVTDNFSVNYNRPRATFSPPSVQYRRPTASISGSANYQRPTISVTWPNASMSGSINHTLPTATFSGVSTSLEHFHTHSYVATQLVGTGVRTDLANAFYNTIGEITGRTSLNFTPAGTVTLSGGGISLSGLSASLSGGSMSLSGGGVSLSGLSVSLSGGGVSLAGGTATLTGGSMRLSGGVFGGGASNQLPPAPYIQVVYCKYTQ